MTSLFYDKMNGLLQDGTPFVSVTMVDAIGSVPQEVGSKILVTANGLFYGTIGGGKVENKAIEVAKNLLSCNNDTPQTVSESKTQFVEWNLKRDVGMTCGGTVRLYFECINEDAWTIVVFGAGHVAQSLIRILLTLNCRVICTDPRPDWLAQLPESPKLTKQCLDNMASTVASLPAKSFVILMTMGHGTDKPILLEILRTRQFPYLGVIGSKAKAARLKKDITEAGLPESCQEQFFCPIGLPLGGNQPPEIAISVAAQLIQHRDSLL